MKATYASTCYRCDDPIAKGAEIVVRKGKAIHASCAPGADDERSSR